MENFKTSNGYLKFISYSNIMRCTVFKVLTVVDNKIFWFIIFLVIQFLSNVLLWNILLLVLFSSLLLSDAGIPGKAAVERRNGAG